MSSHSYIVEYATSNGWQNAGWTDNGVPTVFKSRESAQDEINELCIISNDSPRNYRVVKILNEGL